MAISRWMWCFVLCVASVWGCQRPTQAPSPPSAPSKPTEVEATGGASEAPKPPAEPDPTDEQAETELASSEAPTDGESTADDVAARPVAEEGSATSNADPQVSPERLLVFLPGGPLLLDVVLLIEGKPYAQAMEALVDLALERGDTDKDGTTHWEEITSSPLFTYGQMGNVAINNEQERQEAIRLYDTDRDGVADREEMPRFVTRNAGGARGFSFRGSNRHHGRNRFESPLRQLLDKDEDGQLSLAEMQSATAVLASRDGENDSILTEDDFSERLPDEQRRRYRRSDEPVAGWHLELATRWEEVAYAMQDLYAEDGTFTEESFALFPNLWKQLDLNVDSRLDRVEAALLKDLSAHATLTIRFAPKPESDSEDDAYGTGLASMELTGWQANLEGVLSVTESPDAITFHAPGAEVQIFARDLAPQAVDESGAAEQLARLDADKNGYLDAEELETRPDLVNVPLAALDANGDEMVYPSEYAVYLNQRAASQRAQIHGQAEHQPDALFAALDTNDDGRFTARELNSVPERLQTLDTDQDGLRFDEIPDAVAVVLARGNIQMREQLFATYRPAARPADMEGPAWFTAMDANQDGDISPREFLGSSEQFARLDQDQDGFLVSSELSANVP